MKAVDERQRPRRITSGMEKRKMKVNGVLRYPFSGRGIPRATNVHARN
jgi:hypothetical protein